MRLVAILLTAAALTACAETKPVDENAEAMDDNLVGSEELNAAANAAAPAPVAGPANFVAGDGSPLGTVGIEDSPEGLMIRLAGSAMPPGTHGIHLHTVGKCEGPKFESAGSHWNPESKKHGSDNPEGPHKGDLPNVEVAADGALTTMLTVAGVTTADLADADGTAIVVHAKADDNKTDPSGESGDRIACAVLAPAK